MLTAYNLGRIAHDPNDARVGVKDVFCTSRYFGTLHWTRGLSIGNPQLKIIPAESYVSWLEDMVVLGIGFPAMSLMV